MASSRRGGEPRDDRYSDKYSDTKYGDSKYRESKRDPVREPSGSARSGRTKLNEFFVNGEGIHREVLQREICKYLGPEAYSRPSSYNGISGYVVTAVRPFTPKMLDDLVELSEAYISENREMERRGHRGVAYEESKTSRRQEQILRPQGSASVVDDPYYPPQPQYTMASTQQGYPALSASSYAQPQGGIYAGTAYAQDPAYALGPNYGTGYLSGNTRPIAGDNYTYAGNESPRNDPYRQPAGYAGAPRPTQGRVQDPRQDPRFAPVDPRDRMDTRDPRDPRTMQGYASYSSPGDVDMTYGDYVSATPPVQSGRGVPYPTSRPAPSYDPRDTYRNEPVRDPYRNEPIREERRRR